MKPEAGCKSYQDWSRRSLLKGAVGTAAGLLFGPSALAQIALKEGENDKDSLVVIFLRGGADGLNIVVPHAEEAYYKLRPSLALRGPNQGLKQDRVLDLDGFFGFHPAMAPMEPLFKDGKLACVHAVGSYDGTRSHFEAMMAMERGLPFMGPGASRTNGWLARYLNSTAEKGDSPIRALAISDLMPDTLRGAVNTTNIGEIGQYRIQGSSSFREELVRSYAKGDDPITTAGRDTLTVLKTLDRLDYKAYQPSAGTYPTSDLGAGMRQVAFLLKAGVGLEVAFLDKGGWDTHVAQGASTGWQAGLLADVAGSIRAFSDDMGDRMKKTTVVVMTEFGRRAYENSGLGTDHGRASIMFVLGGATKGGKVYGKWPGLEEKSLEGPGDLHVTTDYRSVLAEVLRKRMNLSDISPVFPDFEAAELGLTG